VTIVLHTVCFVNLHRPHETLLLFSPGANWPSEVIWAFGGTFLRGFCRPPCEVVKNQARPREPPFFPFGHMEAQMFASLEPRVGRRLDAYPPEISSRIERLEPNSSINLGIDLFDATIHRDESRYWQTTPGNAYKRPGYRDILRIDAELVRAYETPGGWRLYPPSLPMNERTIDVSTALVIPTLTQMWQWCAQTNLSDATERDWITYSEDDSRTIEESFQRGDTACHVQIGLRRYEIRFTVGSMYALQVDTARNRRRHVRRTRCQPVQLDPPPLSHPTCSLCCDDFSETPAMPWVNTPCGHVFHAACLMPIQITTNRCPMCRRDIGAETR
jgi:hypothetical protein